MNAQQLTQMHHMLSGCLSPDNAVRRAAEATVTAHLNEHREAFIYGLIALIRTSAEKQVRVLSAIFLRQTLPEGDTVLFLRLSEPLQAGIKQELLAAITHEPDRYVRSQISDTVAALASVLIFQNRWPELFPGLYGLCAPEQKNDALKVCALSILGNLSDAADNLLPQVPALHGVFAATLAADNSLAVREAACVACCKVVGILEEKAHIREFQKFIAPILATLGEELAAEDEDAAKRVLAGLTEVATQDGKFFEKDLEKVVQAMYVVGADTAKRDLDEGLRQYACEVLIAMAESLPAMVRRSPSFVKHAVLVCMSLMLCVEEDPAWAQKEDSNDFYDNSNFDCGEMSLDRLAESVQGTKLWPILRPILEQFLATPGDWRYRHAGLFALAQTCAVLSFEALPVKRVCEFLQDAHPRVRYAAVQCLGQIACDFESQTQAKWHRQIFPALLVALADFAHPRVQMHGCSALLNMVVGVKPKVLAVYLKQLMNQLGQLLQRATQMVQEEVMPVMAALAESKDLFLPYYASVMPLLKHIILHASSKATRKLRARAMESATFIGMYMGKEMFHDDAKEIIQMFLQIMQQHQATAGSKGAAKGDAAASSAAATTAAPVDSSDDDYSEQHMLQAWTRICTCLGSEFVPVLGLVMPQVFAAVSRQAEGERAMMGATGRHRRFDDAGNLIPEAGDAEHEGAADDDDDEEEEETNVSRTGLVKSISASAGASTSDAVSDRPMTLQYTSHAYTAAHEDKAMALSMLCSFAHDLRADFLPYVQTSADLVVPLLAHPHDQVQAHAIAAVPHLVRCAVDACKAGAAPVEFAKRLFAGLIAQMVRVFPQLVDAQVLQQLVVALHECLDEAGPLVREVVDAPALTSIGHALLALLKESHKRIALREDMMKAEEEEGDLDAERVMQLEQCNASEDGLHSIVAGCINALIKSHREHFLPVFDELFPEVQRMLSVNSHASTRKIAIFVLDDVIEHLGAAASKYFPHVLESMCIYATDMQEEHGLRQAAAYGIGQAAKHGGPAFQPFKAEILRRFVAAVQADPTYTERAADEPVGRPFEPRDAEDEGAPAVGGSDDEEEGDGEEGEEEEAEEEDGEEVDHEAADEDSRHAALDNLVSAIGLICVYQNSPELLGAWLTLLPLRADDAEAVVVYSLLLDLVDANSPAVLGEGMANLPRIVTIFLSTLGTTMLKNAKLRARVDAFFRNVKAMPQALLLTVAKQVPPQLQQRLQEKLEAL